MNFVILNMSDASNKGDLAIIESTVWLIKKYFNDARIDVLNVDYDDDEISSDLKFRYLKKLPVTHFGSFFPQVFSEGKGLKNYSTAIKNICVSIWILLATICFKNRSQFLVPKKHKMAFKAISGADLVILKGGSYIFSYGGFKQLLFLYRMLYSSFISICLGKKVIALGHSIGPLKGALEKKIAVFCLNQFSKVVVREEISYKYVVDELNINKSKVELLPDLAFWYKDETLDQKDIANIFEKEGASYIPETLKCGLTVRGWHFPMYKNPRKLFEKYLDAVTEVIDRLHKEYNTQVYIMPHALRDIPIGEQIVERVKVAHPFVLKGDYSTCTLRKLYGAMDIFIGTRIHSDIFALSQGVPTLAIAYEIPKGFGIISMVEDRDCIIDIAQINEDVLIKKSEKLISQKEARKKEIFAKVDTLRNAIENAFLRLLN